MAFKKSPPISAIPKTPEKLFFDLPRRKISSLYGYQQEILNQYTDVYLNQSDVAFQLPTGSGKTLVSLLIAEWRRKKFNEKVVIVTSTKQLVNQIVNEADNKYGISVVGFTGSKNEYSTKSKADYKSNSKIAVTNYSSLFNTNPFFHNADVLILDDVHTSENYVSNMWSFSVERLNEKHKNLHTALSILLKDFVDPYYFSFISGQLDNESSKGWVDMLPLPDFVKISNEIVSVVDQYIEETGLKFKWQTIRENLDSCQLYYSSKEILIKPVIPPTWTHNAFTSPKQRIYMSATLGEGGELERLLGREKISRIPIAKGFDIHGVGRRFFIFPELALSNEETEKLKIKLIKSTERSIILVPSIKIGDEITETINNDLLPI